MKISLAVWSSPDESMRWVRWRLFAVRFFARLLGVETDHANALNVAQLLLRVAPGVRFNALDEATREQGFMLDLVPRAIPRVTVSEREAPKETD